MPTAMALGEFTFSLPERQIALRPAEPRESAKLLCVGGDGALSDREIGDLPLLLRRGDALVINDSWVIRAALVGWRGGRAGGVDIPIRCNLLRRLAPDCWEALARPGKRLRVGDILTFGAHEPTASGSDLLGAALRARIEAKHGASLHLRFDQSGGALDAAIEVIGSAPLPPYIAGRRAADSQDFKDYQTLYADKAGAHVSVAAPTAGLHITEGLLKRFQAMGVAIVRLSLGVGAGTFLPVAVDDVSQHAMHSEPFRVSEEAASTINAARASGGRIVSVGTTALRALESCPWPSGKIQASLGETRIFLRPGSCFHSADMLLTNFHLPRSTLFMLVCGFAGIEAMQRAYAHAINADYRFYSYGDANLLWRAHG